MNIGDVELAIVSDIEEREQAEVQEIKDPFDTLDNTPVKHESSVLRIIISGFANKEEHSSSLSIEQQKENLKTLRDTDPIDNTIDYKQYYGHLLIESVDLTDTSESRIINDVEIQARYFPWPEYYEDDQP